MVRLRFISFLLLAVTSVTAPVCHAQDQPNFYAVVIGISQFALLPKEEWLEFADADATDFARFIKSPRGRAFPADNVKEFTNDAASLTAMKRWMGTTLPKKLKPEDTVYIFIATHGMVEKEAARAGYLLAHDSDREDLYSTALAMKDLSDIMQNRLKGAKRIFLFADACRAGKLGQGQGNINRFVEDASRRGETMGLLASRPNEFSREGKQFGGGHGVFTYYLLKGLIGEADGDKDKTVTAAEIVSYLQVQVENATEKAQHVRDFGDFEATTPLAFVDKPAPADLKLTGLPWPVGTEIASLAFMQAPGTDVRTAFNQAIAQGRLLAPAGNNAWDLYQQYIQLPVPQSEKDAVQDDLYIALANAGEKVLAAYRRGDQVIKLDAAKYEEGAQLFARASQLSPDEPKLQAKAKSMAGRAMVANGRYAEAVSVLREAIALDPEAAHSYNALGIAYKEQRQWNEAIENFRGASARAEKWVYPHFNLAAVYEELQRYREAEQEYKIGIDLGTELGMRYFYLHNNLGLLYFRQGRYADAEQQLRRAIEMKPDGADSYYNLGLIFQQRGNAREAEAHFRKAAELDARHVPARLKLAEIYRQQRKRDLEENVLRQAVAGDPRSAAALESLGQVLLENKKLEEAEQVFLQMLALDTSSPVALSWLGDVHAAQRNFEQAAEDYRHALDRSADQKFRRDLQRKLSSVEKKK